MEHNGKEELKEVSSEYNIEEDCNYFGDEKEILISTQMSAGGGMMDIDAYKIEFKEHGARMGFKEELDDEDIEALKDYITGEITWARVFIRMNLTVV